MSVKKQRRSAEAKVDTMTGSLRVLPFVAKGSKKRMASSPSSDSAPEEPPAAVPAPSAVEVRRARRQAAREKQEAAATADLRPPPGATLVVRPLAGQQLEPAQSHKPAEPVKRAANGKIKQPARESSPESSEAESEVDQHSSLPDNLLIGPSNTNKRVKSQSKVKQRYYELQEQQPLRITALEISDSQSDEDLPEPPLRQRNASPTPVAGPSTLPLPPTAAPKARPSFIPEAGSNITRVIFNADDVTKHQLHGRGFVVGLKHEQALTLCGAAQLRVLHGAVTLQECLLTPASKPLDLCAPTTHVLPRIEATKTATAATSPLLESLSSADLSHPIHPNALTAFQAVLLLTPTPNTGIQDIEPLVKLAGISSRASTMWSIWQPGPNASWSGPGFQLVVDETTNAIPASPTPSDWQTALDQLQRDAKSGTQVRLVCVGVKRSGKSTLARCAVNRLLRSHPRVAWLDLDLGQPELTPSGILSLHLLDEPLVNPSFIHQRTPLWSHFVGDTTPLQAPDQVLAAASDLFRRFQALEDQTLPLIINVFGASKGLISDLSDALLQICQPTHILRFTSAPPTAPSSAAILPVSPLSENALAQQKLPHAAELRILALLSYFHQVGPSKWRFDPLTGRDCFSVKWTDLQQIFITGAEVSYSSAILALNASIVALVHMDTAEVHEDLLQGVGQLPFKPTALLPAPQTACCLGLGIIKSVNPENLELELITSVPAEQLSDCNGLVRGRLELPTVFHLHGGTHTGMLGQPWSSVPYLESSVVASAASIPGDVKRHVRRNIARSGQQQP